MTMQELAITSQGVISAFGAGVAPFTEGVRSERCAVTDTDGDPQAGPLCSAGVARDFDVRSNLGRKGTRNFDRTTAMVVAATGMAIDARKITGDADRTRIGLAMGTSTGSLRSIMDFTHESLTQKRPYLVNPVLFPNTVMNCAAGQAAIWHDLKGVNATISGGMFSTLLALQYARTVLSQQYADMLLVGAVEELCEHTAWGYRRSPTGTTDGAPMGEGCGVFAVELADHARRAEVPELARVKSLRVGLYTRALAPTPEEQAEGVRRCIGEALEEACLRPTDVWAVSRGGAGRGRLPEVERQVLQGLFGDHRPAHDIAINERVGDALSASGAMQIAALLSLFELHPYAGERYSMCTCVGQDGFVGCLVLAAGEAAK